MNSMEWKKWLENERVKKLFRRENLLVMVLVGILLFVIALPAGDSGGNAADGKEKITGQPQVSRNEGNAAAGGGQAGNVLKNDALTDNVLKDMDEAAVLNYAADMERRLTEALSEMAEVGKVRVMITLRSSSELVVEKEMPESRSVTTETDAQGGSRRVDTSQVGESVVYSTEDGNSTPYVVKTYMPEVEGVLVVAEGAGSGTVNRTVTEIVQALFSLEAHKIKVVKMETKTR